MVSSSAGSRSWRGKTTSRLAPALLGFVAGCLFLLLVDRTLPHLHAGFASPEVEGIRVPWSRTSLLIAAITLHNVPEGLAVGVAFGAARSGGDTALVAALVLAVGKGIQNLPEGSAVALPLRGQGLSRRKSFFYGQLSAVVEPLAAVVGAALVSFAQPVLPYALAFAAGAMLYVVVEEVIPES